jgi:hypothetical protein
LGLHLADSLRLHPRETEVTAGRRILDQAGKEADPMGKEQSQTGQQQIYRGLDMAAVEAVGQEELQ